MRKSKARETSPPTRTVTVFVASATGVGHPSRQIGPVFDTEEEARSCSWAKRAIKGRSGVVSAKAAVSRATITFVALRHGTGFGQQRDQPVPDLRIVVEQGGKSPGRPPRAP